MNPRLYIFAVLTAILELGFPVRGAAVPVQVISGCTDIVRSGVYVLDRDISGRVDMACLQIRDVSDVVLDCQEHSITTDSQGMAAVLVQAAKNFSIRSCRIPQLSGYSMYIGHSADGMITGNVLRDMVVDEPREQDARSLRLVGNQFSQFGERLKGELPGDDYASGVIPITGGLNQLLARHLTTPELPAHEITTAMASISATVSPNPWRGDRHTLPVKFSGLPAGATLKLFTVSGRWIRTLRPSADTAAWDLTNDSGDPVASGIYLYVITAEPNLKTIGKLAVIR